MDWSNNRCVIHTLIGILLGAGFVIPSLWWGSLMGIVWLVSLVLKKESTTWGWCLYAYLIKYLFALSWFWSTYPIDWLGVPLGGLELPIIAVYWLTGSLWLGLGGVVFYWLSILAKKYISLNKILFLIPFIWLLAELSGAWLFSVFSYGPGAQLTTSFSFGFVGYHLAHHASLITLAAWGGVYLLTLVLVLVSCVGFIWWEQKKLYLLLAGIVILFTTSFISLPYQKVTNENITKIAIVDTSFPNNSWVTDKGLQEKNSQNQAALLVAKATNPDYIVFPEGGGVFDQTTDIDLTRAALIFKHADTDAVIIDSGRNETAEETTLQAMVYDGSSNKIYTSQKRYLVPQGEFMPWLYSAILKVFGYGEIATRLQDRLSYRVGDETSQQTFAANIPPVLFCFESVAPNGVRVLLQEREESVPFVAHVVSHAWFNEPVVLWQQLESMLRIQAIWNGVYIVSAGNHAYGYTVTPNGDILYPEMVEQGEYWQVGTIDIQN